MFRSQVSHGILSVIGFLLSRCAVVWCQLVWSPRIKPERTPPPTCPACRRNLLLQWALFLSTLFMQLRGRPVALAPAPPPAPAPRPRRPADERGLYGPPLGEVFGTADKREEDRRR